MHADSSITFGSSRSHTRTNLLVRIRATVPGTGGQGSLDSIGNQQKGVERNPAADRYPWLADRDRILLGYPAGAKRPGITDPDRCTVSRSRSWRSAAAQPFLR